VHRAFVVAALSLGLASAACASPAPSSSSSATHEFKRVAASANYPLKTCVVTGEELGDVPDRVAYSYDGAEVQFCCPGCAKTFQRDPEKYLAQVRAAK